MSKLILFQGDSITDAGRNKEKEGSLGTGYANLVSATLGFEHPGEYAFLNRGISGNRIVNLYERIKKDLINLKPDYLSILIGINDVWHEYVRQNGVSLKKYDMVYRLFLDEIMEELPECKIMILEPFVLPGTATETDEEHPGRWELFSSDVPQRAAIAQKIAQDYHLPFIPLQKLFDEACKTAPANYWLRDGVHPTVAGHELIKREWLRTFETIK